MANMFRTIEQQRRSSAPEWLSDHPNPGNRYEAIQREAETLRVDDPAPQNRIADVHAQLSRLPPAPTSAQVAQRQQQGRQPRPVGTSGNVGAVQAPSGQWQTVQPADFLRLSVPANWRQVGNDGGSVMYVPNGGYVQGQDGQSAFTHGVELGVLKTDGGSLQQNTDRLLQAFARTNPQLRRQKGYARTNIGGRNGLATTLTNVSEVTGEGEIVSLSTTTLSDGSLLYLLGVAPSDDASIYVNTFSRVRQSVQLMDGAR